MTIQQDVERIRSVVNRDRGHRDENVAAFDRIVAALPREVLHPDYVTMTNGMRGYFAVHMRWYEEDGHGMYEPQQSSPNTYRTIQGAERDGKAWAEAEGLEFRP